MKDSHLENMALIGIIAGLLLLFFFILDYEPKDAFYLSEDDSNIFLEGNVKNNRYNEESGFTYLEISSCRTFDAFYEGKVGSVEVVSVKGTYREGLLNINKLIIHN